MTDYERRLSVEPRDLFSWLHVEFDLELPQKLTSIKDMEEASELLIRLSANYSYLAALLSFAKILTNEAWVSGDKEQHKIMVLKKDMVENTMKATYQLYQGLSRAITVHIDNNKEIHMGERSVYTQSSYSPPITNVPVNNASGNNNFVGKQSADYRKNDKLVQELEEDRARYPHTVHLVELAMEDNYL